MQLCQNFGISGGGNPPPGTPLEKRKGLMRTLKTWGGLETFCPSTGKTKRALRDKEMCQWTSSHEVSLSIFYVCFLFSPCHQRLILLIIKYTIFQLLTNFTISKPTWVQSVTRHGLATFNYPLWWTLTYLEAILLSCCNGDAYIGALRDNVLRHLTQLAPCKLF